MKDFGKAIITGPILLCSLNLFRRNSHDKIAEVLEKFKGSVHFVCPSDIRSIEFQNEKLKEIMKNVYVLEKSRLCDNYDQIRKKSTENIFTLGYGVAELRTLGNSRQVEKKLDLDDSGEVIPTIELTEGKKICDMHGFVERCYDIHGNTYDIDESTKYGSEYLVYEHSYYAVKFFKRELTEGFKQKLDVLTELKKENSPFVRALPILFLYKSEQYIDSNICGYAMMKFDKPIRYIGDYTNSRFNDNVEDKFKDDILLRMKILASLADCFVFYHLRDILLSDIKQDNFFVDPSDFTVFPIDSDGFSCHGGNSEYPRPEYSDISEEINPTKIKNYQQSLNTELYGLTALIFYMLTTRNFSKYKKILREKKKENKGNFPGDWYTYPEYIREQFVNAAKGVYLNAYEWKCIFDRYISELSRTDLSEYMRNEIIRLKSEKENDIIKIKSLETECKKSKNDLIITKEESKKKDDIVKSCNTRNEELQMHKNRLIAIVIILSILLILGAGWIVYIYFGPTDGATQLSLTVYETHIVYACNSEQQNKIIKYGGKNYERYS